MSDLEQRLAELSAKATDAIEITEGKYFGDYDMGEGDRDAVDTLADIARAYRAGELVPATTLAAKDARIAELEAQNASLRHWSVGHIDALLLYAAGTYPNDSHVREAVEFCRIVAPGKKLRMDPLNGSDFHPARESLRPARATGADHD